MEDHDPEDLRRLIDALHHTLRALEAQQRTLQVQLEAILVRMAEREIKSVLEEPEAPRSL